MIRPDQALAIYLPGSLLVPRGKMGHGVLRYSPHRVVAAIDPDLAGKRTGELLPWARHDCPVVSDLAEARALGADVLVLGIAPLGGKIPADWLPDLQQAVDLGMSIVNGLHDHLAHRLRGLRPGQYVWDIRREPAGLSTATAAALGLRNRRLLMVGIDMSIGKMTAGLEIHQGALARGVRSAFVATGQIGITITGSGVPLDAVRLDYACGAIEREVMAVSTAELIVVEGQGSLLHPASTATLPLLRGTMPTHLVLCTRVGQTGLRDYPQIKVPPLLEFARLYEELASVGGVYPRPRTVGLAVNSGHVTDAEARAAIAELEAATGLPATDVIRYGADKLVDAVLASPLPPA
jgi:uncharacterized NAD-dependent epimerase/dehydratase family protein